MAFQISALDRAQFADLFELSDEQLKERGAIRVRADRRSAFPCRVSLADAELGEDVLLINYEHLAVNTPFRASYAIYVRPKANQAHPEKNQIPEMLRSRILSLRGFDRQDMLKAAEIAEGQVLETALEQMFSDAAVAYIHVHFAKAGCYAARVDRA